MIFTKINDWLIVWNKKVIKGINKENGPSEVIDKTTLEFIHTMALERKQHKFNHLKIQGLL